MTPECLATLKAADDYFNVPERHAVFAYFVRDVGGKTVELKKDSYAASGRMKEDVEALAPKCSAMCAMTAFTHFAPNEEVANEAAKVFASFGGFSWDAVEAVNNVKADFSAGMAPGSAYRSRPAYHYVKVLLKAAIEEGEKQQA